MFGVILYRVYQLLRVLHSYAQGKWLGFKLPSSLMEQEVDVACRMAGGEYYGFALIAVAVLINHACDLLPAAYCLLPANQIRHTAVEMVLSAVFHYGLSHTCYDRAQPVCSYMAWASMRIFSSAPCSMNFFNTRLMSPRLVLRV